MMKATKERSMNQLSLAAAAESFGLCDLGQEFYDGSEAMRLAIAERCLADIAASDSEEAAIFRATHGLDRPLEIPHELRPHGLEPPAEPPVVVFCYRARSAGNFIGLGVSAGMNALTMRDAGYPADALAVDPDTIFPQSVRLVVLEGNALDFEQIGPLAAANSHAQFVWRCHSNIAFLQVEPTTIATMRAVIELSNVRLSGNHWRFTEWASEAWGRDVLYLPNIYRLPPERERPPRVAPLRLGSFGALRLQKHQAVNAAAAILVARRLGCFAELFVNTDATSGGSSVCRSIEEMTKDTPVTVVKVPWQAAPDFRETVATMALCFQLSASETFSSVTADAAAAGVPTVVGEAIDWAPFDWQAPIDDPLAAAEVGLRLLKDETAGGRGREALQQHCRQALRVWTELIGC